MKKIFIAGIAVSAVLSLTACGHNDVSSQSDVTLPTNTTASTTETSASTAETATSVTETTTVAATEADNSDIASIVGKWDYQTREQTLTDDWKPISLGTITVNADGTYTYEPNEGGKQTGSVTLRYEEYSNGTTAPFYSFMNDNGEFFIAAYCNQNEKDIYYLGNGGQERIARPGVSESAGTAEETANEWGFITANELPENGLSVGVLEGKWQNTQDDSETITFFDCDRYSGSYKLENHADLNEGKVVLEYNYSSDNTKVYWFNLYRNAGGAPLTLAVPQDIPADTLYPLEQAKGSYARVND
ncbi:MAG: hypothetical protein IKP78_01360 [Ruminococcus sp.]|nr:hypothetical protein [Ruminococcus sp.]